MLLLLATFACDSHHGHDHEELSPAPVTQAPAEVPAGPRVSAARYVAELDTEGLTLREGGGWSVKTDLGYTVSIEEAWVVNYAVSLVACVDVVPAAKKNRQGASLWSPLMGSLMGGAAWAGHGDEADPSTLLSPVAQDLARPASLLLGETRFPAMDYCRVHSLVARGTDGVQGAPEQPPLQGLSLYLQGQVTSPAGKKSPLLLNATLANGRLDELTDALAADPGHPEALANVTITRKLSTLFDGVQFATASDRDLGWAVLKNLLAQQTVRVSLEAIDPEVVEPPVVAPG